MGCLELMVTRACIEEVNHFVELVLMSGREFLETLFGDQTRRVLAELYLEKENLFSHECCMFAKINDCVAGMALAYPSSYATRFRLRTGALLIKKVGILGILRLLKVDKVIGRHERDEFYISNLAVYDDFRRKGLARELLRCCFENAKRTLCVKVTLDVEEENEAAIKLYTKMGFQPERKSVLRLGRNIFRFIRMSKKV